MLVGLTVAGILGSVVNSQIVARFEAIEARSSAYPVSGRLGEGVARAAVVSGPTFQQKESNCI